MNKLDAFERLKNSEVGRRGEKAAIDYLEKIGYYILTTNYRAQSGEIDIIAQSPERDYLVFIEVKTRHADRLSRYGRPAEAVNNKKQRKIINTALNYISSNSLNAADISCRFDVLEVFIKNNMFEYNHIVGAFGE